MDQQQWIVFRRIARGVTRSFTPLPCARYSDYSIVRLTCIPGLLSHLPPFIRGLARARRWIGGKICLYHACQLTMRTSEMNL
jgi:hypothetical protein